MSGGDGSSLMLWCREASMDLFMDQHEYGWIYLEYSRAKKKEQEGSGYLKVKKRVANSVEWMESW